MAAPSAPGTTALPCSVDAARGGEFNTGRTDRLRILSRPVREIGCGSVGTSIAAMGAPSSSGRMMRTCEVLYDEQLSHFCPRKWNCTLDLAEQSLQLIRQRQAEYGDGNGWFSISMSSARNWDSMLIMVRAQVGHR